MKDIDTLLGRVESFTENGKLTPIGRLVVGLSDSDLERLVKHKAFGNFQLEVTGFFIDFAAKRMQRLLPVLLTSRGHAVNRHEVAALILRKCGKRFEKEVLAFFNSIKNGRDRFELAQAFYDHDPKKYRDEALRAARLSLTGPPHANNHEPVAEWMLEKFGTTVLPDIVNYIASADQNGWWKPSVVTAAARVLQQQSLPALHAALKTDDLELALATLPHLMALADDSQDELIAQTLKRGFEDSSKAVRFVSVAARWKIPLIAESLWALLAHKSKPVRDAAARALASLGDVAARRAGKLLGEKKADTRAAAVIVLITLGSDSALKVLEKHVDDEPDDTVRDAMLLGLEAARATSGHKITRREIEARISRCADKHHKLPAPWIKEARLPALKFKDGKPLSKEAVRYLLYRQSRAREMRADIEAKPLYALIDRKSSGDFAIEIIESFFASKVDAGDRWALALAALLGDERIVPILNQQIRHWADSSRGKMAEYAVEALALLGTDAALLTVDALAIRYRAKNKNVGKAAVEAFAAAAENLGITPDALGDRVVPWLGFKPGQKRIIDCGTKKVEARIGSDLKLQFVDLEKNKPMSSLPKTARKEVLAEFKELGATLREIVKAQTIRLENLMVRQHRWAVQRWTKLFTMHPVLLPMAARLIWGVYDDAGKLQATFRPLEDRTVTQASDEPFTLPPNGGIGIIHPLELTENQRKAWQTHMADYEITPPFPQLERPVVQVPADRINRTSVAQYAGTSVNGMTFKGRADRLGWTRGSVCDGGSITTYYRSFPGAGVDAFLSLDGLSIGMDMYDEIELEEAFFVRSGSVKTGSYLYDEPGDDSDDRLLRLGDIPPIVYSEVLGDLRKIAGTKEPEQGDDE